MHTQSIAKWEHGHSFGQEETKVGERRTLLVIIITASMMIVEIVAGIIFGSMALLADGLHMASHAIALTITVLAYIYARRHARDQRFSFGTGKVNALAGFTSAILLVVFAFFMVWESIQRFIQPIDIAFNQAILVAVLGLAVNGICVFILGDNHKHHHEDDAHHKGHHHHDLNLRAAYLHVFVDALTSLLAIGALLTGKLLGWRWMDPLMGIVGAALVARWSWNLLRDTCGVLLDRQGNQEIMQRIKTAIEVHVDNRISDLHVWAIGPGIRAASITVVTSKPESPKHYKDLIPSHLGIVHAVVEVHACQHRSGK
jgi:cation diffusion facilitator family transporter